MKVGVTLPQFRGEAGDALAAAIAADADPRIDGVFVFDHLWAIGQPERPALSAWPLLGALAQRTERVVVGTLVARVSLETPVVLAHHVETMLRIVGPKRFIAGLGAGDRLSKPENEAYGIPFPPLDERLVTLEEDVTRAEQLGATVWIGGLSRRVTEIARRTNTPLNVWGVNPDRVAKEATQGETTWGGILTDHVGQRASTTASRTASTNATTTADAAGLLRALAHAGATWAVIAPAYRQGAPPDHAIKTVSDAVAAAYA